MAVTLLLFQFNPRVKEVNRGMIQCKIIKPKQILVSVTPTLRDVLSANNSEVVRVITKNGQEISGYLIQITTRLRNEL